MIEFKIIPGHSEYVISECGIVKRIKGCKQGKQEYILKRSFHCVKGKEYPNGYMYITLLTYDGINDIGEPCQYSKPMPIALHRLLAIVFIPNPENKPQVNHKDTNKLNNLLNNLEWSTVKENIQHSYDNGRITKKGPDHWLYGTKIKPSTKKRMSEAKQGKNHPKYKGFYMVYHLKYYSAIAAGKETGLNYKTIIRRCKKGTPGEDFYFVFVNSAPPLV